MFYRNFEDHITHKYGLILEGWPIKVFDAPGHINSRPDLTTLLNAFTEGTARFRRLSDTEFAQWEKADLPGTFPCFEIRVVEFISIFPLDIVIHARLLTASVDFECCGMYSSAVFLAP